MPTSGAKGDGVFKFIQSVALLGLMFAGFCLVGIMERQDQLKAMEQYCELVAMHKFDPDVGWPDYNNVFDEQCTPEGNVQPQLYEQ